MQKKRLEIKHYREKNWHVLVLAYFHSKRRRILWMAESMLSRSFVRDNVNGKMLRERIVVKFTLK